MGEFAQSHIGQGKILRGVVAPTTPCRSNSASKTVVDLTAPPPMTRHTGNSDYLHRNGPALMAVVGALVVASVVGYLFTIPPHGSRQAGKLSLTGIHGEELQSTVMEYQRPDIGVRIHQLSAEAPRAVFKSTSVQSPVVEAPPVVNPLSRRHLIERVHSVIRTHAPKHQSPRTLAEAIVDEAHLQRYDPLFVAAVIKSESTFNAFAKSHKGAQGLMQIMPRTGAWLASKEDLPKGKLTDPGYNLKLGVTYLKHLEGLYDGNRVFVLIAYNWGPGHVESASEGKRRVPSEVVTYAVKIMNDFRKWSA